ncbi:hypothetical protein PFISCL1PPCAC_8266, partial [Pristionchus fissidentatus]
SLSQRSVRASSPRLPREPRRSRAVAIEIEQREPDAYEGEVERQRTPARVSFSNESIHAKRPRVKHRDEEEGEEKVEIKQRYNTLEKTQGRKMSESSVLSREKISKSRSLSNEKIPSPQSSSKEEIKISKFLTPSKKKIPSSQSNSREEIKEPLRPIHPSKERVKLASPVVMKRSIAFPTPPLKSPVRAQPKKKQSVKAESGSTSTSRSGSASPRKGRNTLVRTPTKTKTQSKPASSSDGSRLTSFTIPPSTVSTQQEYVSERPPFE